MRPTISGARARASSSCTMKCSTSPAPRPPYASGQATPTHRPPASFACHSRPNATSSARSSKRGGSPLPYSQGRCSSSHDRTSERNAASLAVGVRSMRSVPLGLHRLVGSGDETSASYVCGDGLRSVGRPVGSAGRGPANCSTGTRVRRRCEPTSTAASRTTWRCGRPWPSRAGRAVAVPEDQGGIGLGWVEVGGAAGRGRPPHHARAAAADDRRHSPRCAATASTPSSSSGSPRARPSAPSPGRETPEQVTVDAEGALTGRLGPSEGVSVADVLVVIEPTGVHLVDLTSVGRPERQPAMDITRTLSWVDLDATPAHRIGDAADAAHLSAPRRGRLVGRAPRRCRAGARDGGRVRQGPGAVRRTRSAASRRSSTAAPTCSSTSRACGRSPGTARGRSRPTTRAGPPRRPPRRSGRADASKRVMALRAAGARRHRLHLGARPPPVHQAGPVLPARLRRRRRTTGPRSAPRSASRCSPAPGSCEWPTRRRSRPHRSWARRRCPAPSAGRPAAPQRHRSDHLRPPGDPASTDRTWTHAEYFAESCRWANLLLGPRDRGQAAPRRGPARQHARVPLRVRRRRARRRRRRRGQPHPRRRAPPPRRPPHRLRAARSTIRATPGWPTACSTGSPHHARGRAPSSTPRSTSAGGADPHARGAPRVDPWALIFTSGTSSAPKAVICSQRRILATGARMAALMELDRRRHRLRVHAAVPLELGHGRVGAVGRGRARRSALAPKFSASGWLPDVRRYGATYFNYTGKPLAYILAQPETPDDADNTLRVAYGNEGAPADRRGVRAAVRRRRDRRVRRDRGRPRRHPRRRARRPARSG